VIGNLDPSSDEEGENASEDEEDESPEIEILQDLSELTVPKRIKLALEALTYIKKNYGYQREHKFFYEVFISQKYNTAEEIEETVDIMNIPHFIKQFSSGLPLSKSENKSVSMRQMIYFILVSMPEPLLNVRQREDFVDTVKDLSSG
jgi:hypothetical protein